MINPFSKKFEANREFDESAELSAESFNFKMTDLQASLGLAQLTRLDMALVRRVALAERYSSALSGLSVTLPFTPSDRTHIFYRYILSVAQPLDDLLSCLQNRGIQCRRPIYKPLHHYLSLPGRYPVSEEAFASALSLPIYPALTNEESDMIVQVLSEELN